MTRKPLQFSRRSEVIVIMSIYLFVCPCSYLEIYTDQIEVIFSHKVWSTHVLVLLKDDSDPEYKFRISGIIFLQYPHKKLKSFSSDRDIFLHEVVFLAQNQCPVAQNI